MIPILIFFIAAAIMVMVVAVKHKPDNGWDDKTLDDAYDAAKSKPFEVPEELQDTTPKDKLDLEI